MFENKKKNGWRISAGTIACASLAVITLAVCAILMIYTELPSVWIIYGALGVYLFFLLCLGIVALIRRRARKDDFFTLRESVFGTLSKDFMRDLYSPILIFDEKGRIVWHNRALKSHFSEKEVLRHKYVEDICNVSIAQILTESGLMEEPQEQPTEPQVEIPEGATLQIERDINPPKEPTEIVFKLAHQAQPNKEDIFFANAYAVSYRQKPYYVTIFRNVLETKLLKKRLEDEEVVIAYVVIDNLEELMMHVQEIYATATVEVERLLRNIIETGYTKINESNREETIQGMGGIVRPYGNNKFLIALETQKYNIFESERFSSLLDGAREIRVGASNLPVTLSIGVAKIKGSFYDKERAAQAALDIALQRGGDQTVVKHQDSLSFYGGKTKTAFKRSKVYARVILKELLHLIASAENVLIMGHKFPDFDALASCLAIHRMAKFCGTPAYIICDQDTPALSTCFRRLAREKKNDKYEYDSVFVDKAGAQDLIRSETLAVMVDVNNMKICEAPDVIHNVNSYVIIDHHIQTAEFTEQPKLCYIDPLASSTSELLSEFLEQLFPSKAQADRPITEDYNKNITARDIPPVELDLLLAGIVLDTKNFTANTHERTFAAAMYLRGLGADPMRTKEFFKIDYLDFTSEVDFEANLRMYGNDIIIALNENENNPPSARINAARAADRLLNVEGVEASFAICRIGDSVQISARSQGKINVQLILEKMGGGGHFDSAGAQMRDASVSAVLPVLRAAIDEYLEESKPKKDPQA